MGFTPPPAAADLPLTPNPPQRGETAPTQRNIPRDTASVLSVRTEKERERDRARERERERIAGIEG